MYVRMIYYCLYIMYTIVYIYAIVREPPGSPKTRNHTAAHIQHTREKPPPG